MPRSARFLPAVRPLIPAPMTATVGRIDGSLRSGRRCVEGLDAIGVLRRDRLALELHRRRQLVAAGLPLLGEQREALDLLDARELLVGAVDRRGDAGLDARVGGV